MGSNMIRQASGPHSRTRLQPAAKQIKKGIERLRRECLGSLKKNSLMRFQFLLARSLWGSHVNGFCQHGLRATAEHFAEIHQLCVQPPFGGLAVKDEGSIANCQIVAMFLQRVSLVLII